MEGIMLTTIPSHPLHKGTLDNELSCRSSHCWHLNPRRKTQGNQHPSPCYQVGEGDSKDLSSTKWSPAPHTNPERRMHPLCPTATVCCWFPSEKHSGPTQMPASAVCCCCFSQNVLEKKKEQFSFKIRMFSLFGSSGFFFFSSQKIGEWFWRGKAKTCLLLNISYTLCSAQLHTVRYRTGRNPTVHKATQCGTGGKKLKERQERSFLN